MVGRVLIDNKSDVSIIFKGAIERMGILDDANKRRAILQTLNRALVQNLRTIKLAVEAKSYDHLVAFHVMDYLTPYNAILCWNWLHIMRIVISTNH